MKKSSRMVFHVLRPPAERMLVRGLYLLRLAERKQMKIKEWIRVD